MSPMQNGKLKTKFQLIVPTMCSLRFRIRVIICVCLVLFSLCAVLAIHIQFDLNYNEIAKLEVALTESYFLRIEEELEKAQTLSMQIVANTSIQNQLAQLANLQGDSSAYAQASGKLISILRSLNYDDNSSVAQITLMDQKGNLIYSKSIEQPDLLFEQMRQLIAESDSSGSICWHTVNFMNTDYIVLVRAIREIENTSLRHLGYEIIYLDVQQILKAAGLDDSQYTRGTKAYLSGVCFFQGSECPACDEVYVIPEGQKWDIQELNGSSYLITSATFLHGKMKVINYTNSDKIMKSSQVNRGMMIGMMMIIMLLFLFFIIKIVDKLLVRLNRLSSIVQEAPANDYKITLDEDLKTSKDEIGIFARYFQEQMNQIEILINKNYKQQLLASQAQIQTLQAQINPHFLFNTLDTIHSIAERDQNLQIAKISQSLSKLVRASFRGKAFVPLSDEIEFVQEYLFIYRTRFGKRLIAQIDWSEQDENIILPRMILQPIVENSVRYGLMSKPSVGVIRLRIRRSHDTLVISFYDNGNGFSREALEKYRSEALGLAATGDMHGLTNVLYRLRTIYGDRFVFQIHSNLGQWSNIGFRIPIDKQNEEEQPQ